MIRKGTAQHTQHTPTLGAPGMSALDTAIHRAGVTPETARQLVQDAEMVLRFNALLRLQRLKRVAKRAAWDMSAFQCARRCMGAPVHAKTHLPPDWHGQGLYPKALSLQRIDLELQQRRDVTLVCTLLTRAWRVLTMGYPARVHPEHTVALCAAALRVALGIPRLHRWFKSTKLAYMLSEGAQTELHTLAKADAPGDGVTFGAVTLADVAREGVLHVPPDVLLAAQRYTVHFTGGIDVARGARRRPVAWAAEYHMKGTSGLLQEPISSWQWGVLTPEKWIVYETGVLELLNGERTLLP
jgi:hypothetical protein